MPSPAILMTFMPSTTCAARTCSRLSPTKRIERWPVWRQDWLERGSLFLVTQNIDDLHERAGSERVIHMHGELRKARCTACTSVTPWPEDLSVNHACPHCGETGTLRPDVVWFGEVPLHMDAIDDALAQADLFVSIGTSGSVYPAAGFVEQAKAAWDTHL